MTDNEKKQSSSADFTDGPVALDDNVERDAVFYYSRERRLERASQTVRDLHDGKPIRPSLSKTLFATKGNVLVFATIVIFTVFGLTSRMVGRERDSVRAVSLGRNSLALTIVPVEGALVMGMIKTVPKSGEFYTGAVDIAVSPATSSTKDGEQPQSPPVFTHRIFFNPVQSEHYQVSLPFEGTGFILLINTGEEQKSVRLNVGLADSK